VVHGSRAHSAAAERGDLRVDLADGRTHLLELGTAHAPAGGVAADRLFLRLQDLQLGRQVGVLPGLQFLERGHDQPPRPGA
jgi:hypothetical protein